MPHTSVLLATYRSTRRTRKVATFSVASGLYLATHPGVKGGCRQDCKDNWCHTLSDTRNLCVSGGQKHYRHLVGEVYWLNVGTNGRTQPKETAQLIQEYIMTHRPVLERTLKSTMQRTRFTTQERLQHLNADMYFILRIDKVLQVMQTLDDYPTHNPMTITEPIDHHAWNSEISCPVWPPKIRLQALKHHMGKQQSKPNSTRPTPLASEPPPPPAASAPSHVFIGKQYVLKLPKSRSEMAHEEEIQSCSLPPEVNCYNSFDTMTCSVDILIW